MFEPTIKKAITFFDGQNLFHSAREAFGYLYPNYDVLTLAKRVCTQRNWQLEETRFYTGIQEEIDGKIWHDFWSKKLLAISRQGVVTYSRPVRYRKKTITDSNGKQYTIRFGQEKGIDVRIAIDVIRLAHQKKYDVALIFSEDQDFSEVAKEIRVIAQEQNRWIRIACAFPYSSTHKGYGINMTEGIAIDKAMYDQCLASYPQDPYGRDKQMNLPSL